MFDRKGQRKYLNTGERESFLKAVKKENNAARRAFALTLFYTGCRISEGLNLTVERVDQSEKVVTLETLKRRERGVYRSVPIPASLTLMLQKISRGFAPGERIWKFSRPTAYRLIKAMMREAGIEGGMTSPKGLRHSFAIACIKAGIPLTTIKKWLGHARLSTTEIYLQFLGEDERDLAKRLWKRQEK